MSSKQTSPKAPGPAVSQDVMAEKLPRRTQAERSATTRHVLLEAAVDCLYRQGYGATTTVNVAEAAGVSRGAMLHQFPSKAELMVFVVEEVFAQDVTLYRELLAGIDNPRERLMAYPAAAWTVLSRPAGVAVIEILQGSRSDPELNEKLSPILERIDAAAQTQLLREFPRGPSPDLRQLIVGAARGLVMMNILNPRAEGLSGAVPLLQRLLSAGLETGTFDFKPDAPPSSTRKPLAVASPENDK